MRYKISTIDKKSVIEKNFYEKDGKSFWIEQGYRWGYFVTQDPVDVEDLKTKDELMIYDYDVEDHSFDDGCWIHFYYDDEISEEEREAIESAWEEDWYEGFENLDWSEGESEVWFLGPLEVEEVNDDNDLDNVAEGTTRSHIIEDDIEDHERD